MTIICQVCGTANPDGTTYCEGCGVELTASAAPAAATEAAPVTEATDTAAETVTATAETPAQTPVETPPLEDVATPAAPVTPLTPPESLTPPAASSSEPVVAPATPAEATTPEHPANAASEAPVAAAPAPTEAAAAPASTGEAKLGIKKFGVSTGDFIPLQGERLVVGRFDASTGPVDIDLSGLTGQEHISRRHAELYRENGVWQVRDLGSTNGVYVKHKGETAFSPRLQEPAALSDGDEIAFGNLMMTFNQG